MRMTFQQVGLFIQLSEIDILSVKISNFVALNILPTERTSSLISTQFSDGIRGGRTRGFTSAIDN